MALKIPVFAYHASNVFGMKYHLNDIVALEKDLKTIKDNAVRIISAHTLIKYLSGEVKLNINHRYAVITFDDGNNLDFCDSQYPGFGKQKSFYSLLQESDQYTHATSFVIASFQARKNMEKECLQGYPLLSDRWWKQAQDSGVLSIENHSWDHVHASLEHVCQSNNVKGDFSKIETFADAQEQVQQASNYIKSITNKQPSLFAYPFGHFNDYLAEEYFPKLQKSIVGAFTCEPNYVTMSTNLWKIPRFVCGCDWSDPSQFKKILIGEYTHE